MLGVLPAARTVKMRHVRFVNHLHRFPTAAEHFCDEQPLLRILEMQILGTCTKELQDTRRVIPKPRFHPRGRACPEQANARRRGSAVHPRGVACFETAANSLFRNILRASSCGSRFYRHAPISQLCKSLGENILEEQRQKQLQRYTPVAMRNGARSTQPPSAFHARALASLRGVN